MTRRHATALVALLLAVAGHAAVPGDIDEDDRARAADLVRLIRHVRVEALLPAASAALADLDQDGAPGALDLMLMRELVMARVLPGTFVTHVASSPAHASQGVAVTRETIVSLGRPLASGVTPAPGVLVAELAGEILPATLYVTQARDELRLYYDEPLPPSARIRVRLATAGLIDVFGQTVDGDGDGLPGGDALIEFDTLSLAIDETTSVFGRVFASELAPGGGSINVPLQGVAITVDGLEDSARTQTDAMGSFVLESAPVGAFFVHVDGRPATIGVPPGAYYPFVGKPWVSVRGTSTSQGDVFLPLVTPGTLQPVSETSDTLLKFSAAALQDHPEFENVSLLVPADSLFADDGTRGGEVGIAPVPPDRLPGPLPPWLQFAVVITVQTDGATNFDRPAPACFPNLPDRATGETLEPLSKSALWSFNHDSGHWEVVGPMTVSEDGSVTCTDPGVGVLAPGWHGTLPGSTALNGPIKHPPPPRPCPPSPRAYCGDGELNGHAPAHCKFPDIPELWDADVDGIPDFEDEFCHPPCQSTHYEECDPGPDADPDECLNCLLPCGSPAKASRESDLADAQLSPECAAVTCITDELGAHFAHVPIRDGRPCNVDNDGVPSSGDPRCFRKRCFGGLCGEAEALKAGAACNDGNACTTDDRCIDGTCAGSPVPDGSNCREPADCVERACLGGECLTGDTLPPFTACNDGKECTFGDHCLGDTCSGVNPFVACPPFVFGLITPANCLVPCSLEDGCGTGLCAPSGDCVRLPFTDREPCCGNGLIEEGEDCDDGNTTGDDGCNGVCQDEAECGDGTVDDGEDCDDGNTEDGDGCSADCTAESLCGNGELDRGEDCDDGNDEPGDGCPPDCNTTLVLEPQLIIGFGDCSNGREYRVLDSQGRDVTSDPAIELVTLPAGLTEGLIDELKQRFGGIVCGPLDALATIQVTPPTLTVATPGLNFVVARRIDDDRVVSNPAFILGLPLKLKELELQPVALLNGAFELAVFATNKAREAAHADPLEVSPPMMLVRPATGPACGQISLRNNLFSTGLISVSNVKVDFACWEDVSLDGLLDEIEQRTGGGSPATMEARLIQLAAGIGGAALLELKAGGDEDGSTDPVLSVAHLNLTPPAIGVGGFVHALASGASTVTATLDRFDCLGKAEGELAVFVLPDIDGIDIRNEDARPEDPIEMESCPPPYARRVHAVGRAQLENAGIDIDFKTDVGNTQEAFEFLAGRFPGIGRLGEWTLPLGAQRNFNSGFYDDGDFFVEADLQLKSTQPLTVTVNSFTLQFPLPTALAEWRIAVGAPGIASVTEPGLFDLDPFSVVLAPLAAGDTTLQAKVCAFAADDAVIDLNPVRVGAACACGDGLVDAGETCDPPGSAAALGRPCRRTCTSCGDLVVQSAEGEDCDDGNVVDNDQCPNDCKIPTGCGDGALDPDRGETCDPPGHGVLAGGFESPFGNTCREDCTYCGDGLVQAGEACDDGNVDDDDACTRRCTLTRPEDRRDPIPPCGDGVIQPPETCEPPDSVIAATGQVCLTTCTFCGDGVLNPGEQCDDGNIAPDDGCEADCTTTPPPCNHDGVLDPGEQCDDGNFVAGDGCEPGCTITGRPIVPPPPSLCITQVVTSPRRDWSSAGFTGIVGTGSVTADDEFVEIVNFGAVPVDVAGFVLSMTDATPCNYALGSASGAALAIGCRPGPPGAIESVEVLQPPGPPFLLQPGGTLTVGNPPDSMDDNVLVEILSGRLVVTSVEIGGNNGFDNFGADDDRDGTVNEDPRDGRDDDGDGLVDEDPAGFIVPDDPVRDGAPGSGLTGRSTNIADEALLRSGSTGQDFSDFRRGSATPGQRRPTTGITIDEVVTDPLQDWSGFLDRGGQPTAVLGNTNDQYIVIVNRGSATVSLRGLILRVEGATPPDTELGKFPLREHFSQGASIDALPPCGVFVLVDPLGVISRSSTTISLREGCLEPFAQLTIGGPQGAPPLIGAPQPQTEAIVRVQHTGNDAADFVRGFATPLVLERACP